MTDDAPTDFEAQVRRVRESGWLGRSHSLTRLFDYLAEAQGSGLPVREADIAQQVFGRRDDLAGDASVRVYIHRLRKKLMSFYAGPGASQPHRLAIPLGDYRLVLDGPESAFTPLPKGRGRASMMAVGLLAVLGLNIGAWLWFGRESVADKHLERAAKGPVWSMINGDRPVKLVVGDYYIFGELKDGELSRMVREFDVNSPEDLQTKLMENAQLQGLYTDLDANYTATGSTEALQYILPVVRAAVGNTDRLQMIASSELTPEMLKSDDIVYVGYLSSLRMLEERVFATSRLRVGVTYDDLVDRKTGRVFDSNAGLAAREAANVDYGYLRAFAGPSGNHIIVVAGTRDIGVVQMAETSIGRTLASGIKKSDQNIELLYEVRGIGRTNISARKVDLDMPAVAR